MKHLLLSLIITVPLVGNAATCSITQNQLEQYRLAEIRATRSTFYLGYWRGIEDSFTRIVDERIEIPFTPVQETERRNAARMSANSQKELEIAFANLIKNCPK